MRLILLMGLPGAGKSTWANAQSNTIVINQDFLGSKQECIRLFKEALKDGTKDITIDRCNINKSQRKTWIDIAKFYGVKDIELLWFNIPIEECVNRVINRNNHLTITNDLDVVKKRTICYNFKDTLEFPDTHEGFTSITIRTTND